MDEMAALDSKRASNKNRDLANHFRTTGYMLQAPISFLQGVGMTKGKTFAIAIGDVFCLILTVGDICLLEYFSIPFVSVKIIA